MSLDDVDVHLVRNLDDALEFKRWLGERHESWTLGLDTETTGLDHQRDVVRLVQIGDNRTGWAIPAEDWRGLVREVIQTYEGPWSGWNTKYDEHMLERYCGAIPRRYHDGAIVAHLADPLAFRALKDTASRLVDPRAGGLDQRLSRQMAEHKWDWPTVPIDFPTYWAYGALDPVLTVRCFEPLHAQALRHGQEPLYELELQAQRVCKQMENRGIRVDVEYAVEQERLLDVEIDAMRAWCQTRYGFSLGSTSRVVEQLQRDGCVWTGRTATGKPSLKRVHIEHLAHPLARAYLRKNQLQVLAHNFFRNIYTYANAEGIIHADINPLQAKTGRGAVAKPSLQNQPRSKRVRDAFIPREGHHLLAADFAQIEMRLLAHFCRDPRLLAFYREGRDLPTEVARAVFQVEGDVPKPIRQKTKSSLYSLGYGAGGAKIGMVLGEGEAAGFAFLDRLYSEFPHLRMFMDRVQDVSRERDPQRPWVESPRWRRRYYVPTPRKAYALVNYLIQGEAGIVFKERMVALDAAGLAPWMVMPIHDEVVSDVPDDQLEDAARIYADVMPDRTNYLVELAVEVGDPLVRWGDKYAEFDEVDQEPPPEEDEEDDPEPTDNIPAAA